MDRVCSQVGPLALRAHPASKSPVGPGLVVCGGPSIHLSLFDPYFCALGGALMQACARSLSMVIRRSLRGLAEDS
jgi:hypothetical protein